MADDLIGLQQSMKQIRNPFGEFIAQWNGKKYRIPQSNKPISLVGPLANHVAKHLYMKARYQYHDQQVARLKREESPEAARRYRVPAEIEDKIRYVITGKRKHTRENKETQEPFDVTALEKTLKDVDIKAENSNDVMDVGQMLDQVQLESIEEVGDAESGRSKGVLDMPSTDAEGADVVAEATQTQAQQTPQTQAESNDPEGAFGELGALE